MAKTYCVNCGEAVEGSFCGTCGTVVVGASESNSGALSTAPSSGKSLQTGNLSFVDAIKSFFANYANFEGRASQSAYWFAVLFTFIVGSAVAIIGMPLADSNGNNPISTLVSLAFLLPGLGVAVRRLHDTGRSGHNLWFALIPLVGAILLIVWLASKSEAADNRFGPRA